MDDIIMNNADNIDIMNEIKIIDYKYDLISKLEKLDIDINNINIKSLVKLNKFFKNFNLIKIICNIFINRFIEECTKNNIVISLYVKENNDKYLKVKINDENYLYFSIFYDTNYLNEVFIEMYWCGYVPIKCSSYTSYNIDMKIIEEGIKFFFNCEYFQKKLTNSIKIILKNKEDNMRDIKNKEYDFEEMDLTAINLGNWFSKKIEDFKKEYDELIH